MAEHSNINQRDGAGQLYPWDAATVPSNENPAEDTCRNFIPQSGTHPPPIIHTPRSSTDGELPHTTSTKIHGAIQPNLNHRQSFGEMIPPIYSSAPVPSRTPPESPLLLPQFNVPLPSNQNFWHFSNPIVPTVVPWIHPPPIPPAANVPESNAITQPAATAVPPPSSSLRPPSSIFHPSSPFLQSPFSSTQAGATAPQPDTSASYPASAAPKHDNATLRFGDGMQPIGGASSNSARLTLSEVLDIRNYCTPEEHVLVDTDDDLRVQLSMKKHELSEWYKANDEWYKTHKSDSGLTGNMQQVLLQEMSRRMYALKESLNLSVLVATVPELPFFVDPHKLDAHQVFNILNYLDRAEYELYNSNPSLAAALTYEVQQIQKRYEYHTKRSDCVRSRQFFCRILADKVKLAKERVFSSSVPRNPLSAVQPSPYARNGPIQYIPRGPDSQTNGSGINAPKHRSHEHPTHLQPPLNIPSVAVTSTISHSESGHTAAGTSQVNSNLSTLSTDLASTKRHSTEYFHLPPFAFDKKLHRKRVLNVKRYCTREEKSLLKTDKYLRDLLDSEIAKLREWYNAHPKKKKRKQSKQNVLRHLSYKVYSMKDRVLGSVLGEIMINPAKRTTLIHLPPHLIDGTEPTENAPQSPLPNAPSGSPAETGSSVETEPATLTSNTSRASSSASVSPVKNTKTTNVAPVRTTPSLNNLITPLEDTESAASLDTNTKSAVADSAPNSPDSPSVDNVPVSGTSPTSNTTAIPQSIADSKSITDLSVGNGGLQSTKSDVKVPDCILRPLFPLRSTAKSHATYDAIDNVGITGIRVPDCLLRRSHSRNGRKKQIPTEAIDSDDSSEPAEASEPAGADNMILPPPPPVSEFYNNPTGEKVTLTAILKIFSSFSPKQSDALRTDKSLCGVLCLALESLLRRYGVLARKVTNIETKKGILMELREKLYALEKSTMSVYDSVIRRTGHNREANYATLLEIGISSLNSFSVRTSLNPYSDVEDVDLTNTEGNLEQNENPLIPPVVMPLDATNYEIHKEAVTDETDNQHESKHDKEPELKSTRGTANISDHASERKRRGSPLRRMPHSVRRRRT